MREENILSELNQIAVSGLSKEAEKMEIGLNINSFRNSSVTNEAAQRGLIKRKRGRPAKGSQGLNLSATSKYIKQLKQRKIVNVGAYENSLAKLRRQATKFYWPFDKQLKLDIDKQKVINDLKEARDNGKNLRVVVRKVGVRHERNLYKHGVKQQLSYIISYLENGKLPKWMKQHFEELLQKDFSNPQCNQMHPPMMS